MLIIKEFAMKSAKPHVSLMLLAHFFKVHESTICRIIQKTEQILRNLISPKISSPKQAFVWWTRPKSRSKDRKKKIRKKVIRVKKKHSFKFQIIICQLTGMILQAVGCPGKVHDYTKFIYSLHNFHLGYCLKINSLSRLNLGE